MKNFILSLGRNILDISVWINVVIGLVLCVLFIITGASEPDLEGMFWGGIIALILLPFIICLYYYFIYLLVDIRDNLNIIANRKD